ncbi:MAG: Fe(3+) dicitrate transport protein [Halieaceae bacterium]|jgi:Fe(3+) dicitrate transport protein
MHIAGRFVAVAGVLFVLGIVPSIALAADGALNPAMESIHIIGSADDKREIPGSSDVISAEDLARFEYTDIHRVLANVPGVYLRNEDGYGLRPNISIRGTYSDRSGKITLMEDGVLIAPAPYTASSAYYFPTTGRLSGVEVLKGSAAIENGPYTIGGAINLLSTPIPTHRKGTLKQELGSDDGYRIHASYGDSTQRFGYLVEAYSQATDGFADIDNSSRDTGFDKDDVLLKLRSNTDLGASIYQQLDLKLQYSEESSDQTYVGLSEADYAADPERRYGLSRLDNMFNRHQQVSLTHFADFNNGFSVSTTAYYNEFSRNWYKVDKIDGEGIDEIIQCANGVACSGVTSAYGDYSQARAQQVLAGTAAADVALKNNSRTYLSRGVQSALGYDFTAGSFDHQVKIGLRYHEDSEARQQPVNTYYQAADASFQLALAGTASRSEKSSRATSWYVTDAVSFADWTVSPGLRVEDYTIAGVANQETLMGLGALYQLTPELQLLAGVHEGHSPSGSENSEPETALNYEAGLRYQLDSMSGELVAFYSDYDNIIGVCTNSGGAGSVICDAGDTENGGAAIVQGLEAKLGGQFTLGTKLVVPLTLSYTYTDSEFQTSFYGKSVWGEVAEGDSLPNMPEHQLALSGGLSSEDGWGVDINLLYAGDTCSTAACGPYQDIDSYYTVDAAAYYDLSSRTRLYLNVANLTDVDDRIVSREPKAGARGLRPRSFTVGFKYDF